MTKLNPSNERIKRAYFTYLREARRRNQASVDGVAKALSRFEEATGSRDFGKFHREQAVSFKRRLDRQVGVRSGETLSRPTVHSTLSALRSFFIWLADQPGYKRRISYSDADYFNLSEKDVRIAQAVREKPCPTLEQIEHVLSVMPARSEIELRDRALIAFALVSGARDGALASLKLKHVNADQQLVDLDAREVKTKFSKTFTTWFFRVSDRATEIVVEWITYLRTVKRFGDADPLFPSTRVMPGADGGFAAAGLDRKHWASAEPIRRIFREAFTRAGLPYFRPHSFRDTLALIGERTCLTVEDFKSWSQNLGHERMLTTLTSYGRVPAHRQAELIRTLPERRAAAAATDAATMESRLAKLELAMAASKRPKEPGGEAPSP